MLKNKLFCSLVVFAAAAIFAVTLVGCGESDPAPGWQPLANEGDAVQWLNMAGTSTGWVIAGPNGVIPTLPPASPAIYHKIGERILKAQILDPKSDTTVEFKGESGKVYEVFVGTVTGSTIALAPQYCTSDGTLLTGTGFDGKKLYVKGIANVVKASGTTLTVPTSIAEDGDIVYLTNTAVAAEVAGSTTTNGYYTVGTSGAITVESGKYYLIEKKTGILKATSTTLAVPTSIAAAGSIVKLTNVTVDAETAGSTPTDGYYTATSGSVTAANGKYYLVEATTGIEQASGTTLTVPSTIAAAGDIVFLAAVKVDSTDAGTTVANYGYRTVGTAGAIALTTDTGVYCKIEKEAGIVKGVGTALTVPSSIAVAGDVVNITGVKVDSEALDSSDDGAEVVGTTAFTVTGSGKYYLVKLGAKKSYWYLF